jgi:hypothetical protein
MRYLKRFDEGRLHRLLAITSTLTTEMLGELRDFCRDYLAYLIDEGFTVQVVPTFYGTECDVFIFKEVKEPFTGIVISQWSSIKDQIIPFLYMLKKHYTIVDADDDHYNRSAQRFFTIQPSEIDSFINDTVDDFKLRKLRIRVNFKDKSITEAISQEDIKDFCEQYLAYLLDDVYALDFRESGRVTQIDLVKPKYNTQHGNWVPGAGGSVDWMDWDHIKDRFIPFLHILDKEYDIKDNLIFFQIRGGSQVSSSRFGFWIKMSFQDVIDDKVKEKIFSVTKGYKNHSYEHATVISSVRVVVLDHSVGQYSWQLRTNESLKDDVLEFTQDRLVYLMDDGFEIGTTDNPVTDRSNNYAGCICTRIVKHSGFTWEEITDRFSPYIYMLNKEYHILEIVFYQNGGRQYQYDTRKDIEELLSGEADQYLTNKFYTRIRIIVKNKE